MRTRRRPELLAPAGDMEKLQMAVAYGADAVYLAGTSFGMRSFAGNFTPEELPKAVALAPKTPPTMDPKIGKTIVPSTVPPKPPKPINNTAHHDTFSFLMPKSDTQNSQASPKA